MLGVAYVPQIKPPRVNRTDTETKLNYARSVPVNSFFSSIPSHGSHPSIRCPGTRALVVERLQKTIRL